jgi:alkaline phosphatase
MKNIKLVSLVLAILFFSTCSSEKAENQKVQRVILFIGDGMGLAQVSAAMAVSSQPLNISKCKQVGLVKTNSIDKYITDSAAGGTAYSTGSKTKNGYLAVDSSRTILKTILEYAEEAGLATGLVATSSITHATPASFISHQAGRENNEAIALDFLKTDIDVFIGGGRSYFANRTDSQNLISRLIDKGYTVPDTNASLQQPYPEKLAWFTSGFHNPSVKAGRGDILMKASDIAMDILNKNKKGFFLMVEGSQIDWGGHANDQEFVISELLDFDKAVGEGMKFADANPGTLIIIVADHETGGASLIDGDLATKKVSINFSTKNHTGIMVPIYTYGSGCSDFTGVFENTAVFDKMMSALNLKK